MTRIHPKTCVTVAEQLASRQDIACAQMGQRMLREEVTAADIAEVTAKWTGIPVAQLLAPEREKLLHLPEALHQRVVGQDQAVDAVADAIQRYGRLSRYVFWAAHFPLRWLHALHRANGGAATPH